MRGDFAKIISGLGDANTDCHGTMKRDLSDLDIGVVVGLDSRAACRLFDELALSGSLLRFALRFGFARREFETHLRRIFSEAKESIEGG